VILFLPIENLGVHFAKDGPVDGGGEWKIGKIKNQF